MFGRRKPMFGGVSMYNTAGIGDDIQREKSGEFDGMMNVQDYLAAPQQPMQQQPMFDPQQQVGISATRGMVAPTPKRGGMFGSGIKWQDALGAFGDAFSGNGPVYAQGKQQRSELMRREQMAQQEAQAKRQAEIEQRDYERENYLFEQNYERNNPKPANDQLTRYMQAGGIDPNSERGKAMYAAAATNTAYPVQGVPYTDEQGNTGIQFIRPNQQAPQPMPAPGTIMADPRLKGGSAPKAQGNFR
jgi:hypothetical protein